MSILNQFRVEQLHKEVAQSTETNSHTGYPATLTDRFRLRQMEKTLQQTQAELELVKTRLSQLEAMLASRSERAAAGPDIEQLGQVASMPPLPITELKELAAMAKRFK